MKFHKNQISESPVVMCGEKYVQAHTAKLQVQKHWNYNLKHCVHNETATGDNFEECFKVMMFVGK